MTGSNYGIGDGSNVYHNAVENGRRPSGASETQYVTHLIFDDLSYVETDAIHTFTYIVKPTWVDDHPYGGCLLSK